MTIVFPKKLTAVLLPGESQTVAFMDGPLVLAGIVAEERKLIGKVDQPTYFPSPHNERHHSFWSDGY